MSRRILNGFYIKTKERQRNRFRRNAAQTHFAQNKTRRNIILKPRQLGFTTEIQLEILEKVLYYPNFTGATIAHKKTAAEKIFKIGKFAWENLPIPVQNMYRVSYDSVRQLAFAANGSEYFVDVEARGATVNHLHGSEVAFWRNFLQTVAASFETVPEEGIIDLESTANGLNEFYDLWIAACAGRNEFTPFFYDWTWDVAYRTPPPSDNKWRDHYKELSKEFKLIEDIQQFLNLDDAQFYWYYLKATRLKALTPQEYPSTAEEAFLSTKISVFNLQKLNRIILNPELTQYMGFSIYHRPDKSHEYIVGIDTAEGIDGDSTGITVIDATNLREVAVFNDSTIEPNQTAVLAMKISQYYDNAFIVPEKNNTGLSTVLKLKELGYGKYVYKDRRIDKITKEISQTLGFRTTGTSRDPLIDYFVEIFDNGDIEINSPITIAQMKTFVRKAGGKREHDEGKHDDTLFALMLAVWGRKFNKKARAFRQKPANF